MPILAGLLVNLLGGIYGLALALFGAKWAARILAASTLASLYVACAITFTVMIVPWLGAFVATGFGSLLGLLFPPIAGTCIASLGTFWACILAKRQSVRLIKMMVSGS